MLCLCPDLIKEQSRTVGSRSGVSLVEVLVLIAIIAALLGLTTGVVQYARNAAASTECKGNLHQLGVALYDYHAINKALPPGISVQDVRAPLQFIGWQTRLLPFLDQSALWQQTLEAYVQTPDFSKMPPHPSGVVIAVFGCPSDPRSGAASKFGNAFTSYLGVEGTNQYRHDGLFYRDSHVRFEDVSDGLSNTLMVGERPPSANERLGWWYAGWGQDKDGSAEMVLGVNELTSGYWLRVCPRGPYSFGPGSFQNQCDAFHFWSPHGGGANFLFADGSVRFITYGAAPLMPALATRNGGEAETLPD